MADPMPLPDHADLPVVEGAPPGSSWGLWGADDRFGCLNLLTPERASGGQAACRPGRSSRSTALDVLDPPLFGHAPSQHNVAR